MLAVPQFFRQRALWAGILAALAAGTGGVWLLGIRELTTILPGTKVGDVTVGGLTAEEARVVIAQAADQLSTLTIEIEGQTYPITVADWGITIDAPETASRALALGNSPHHFVAGWNRIRSLFRGLTIDAALKFDDGVLSDRAAALAKLVSTAERDSSLVYENGAWHATEAQSGRMVDSATIRAAVIDHIAKLSKTALLLTPTEVKPKVTMAQAATLIPQAQARTSEPIILVASREEITIEPAQLAAWTEVVAKPDSGNGVDLRLNQSKVSAFVKTLAEELNVLPTDAKVAFKNGVVEITVASKTGRKLNEDRVIADISASWTGERERRIELVFDILEPEVSSATLQSLGLKELIGKATTSYAGSPDNRKHNIANGVSFLNSKLVKPGTEFSTISALGAVDQTTGYLPELVIKENRTIPEYGGGLCQVSTTLFRAALAAGLPITERRNHSYRVSYYERGVGPGLDATIYLPSPDLKFLNDTPGWILIQGYVTPERDEVTFELYGTSDGRRSQISPPTVYDVTPPGDPIYVETADLPTGKIQQIEKPHEGAKTIVTYTVFNADGSQKAEQVFRSTYKAWPARYLVGTGPAPETPTEAAP